MKSPASYVFSATITTRFCGTLIVAAVVALPLQSAVAGQAAEKIDYNFDVRPILSDRCFACHGPDPKTRKANLRLDTREGLLSSGVIVPGKPGESELIRRISAHDDDRMPPAKSNLHLSEAEIARLRQWVVEGAEYKPHWALLPLPETVPVPAVFDRSWPRGRIDAFVLARLEREALKPSPECTKEAWLRRVSFDLTGLPPTPADVERFLNDHSDGAFERAADRLLASPHYGERMAEDWLDVARYADSFGYHSDGDCNVWPYRDWVIRACNENLPFDQFATWQLAGDLLERPTREQRLATAFDRLNRMTNEGGSIEEEFRQEYVVDRVQTVGTAFLGLTIECARCHDHKFDPITMRDYYGLGAFFNSIDEWGTYDNPHYTPTPTLLLPTAVQERRLAELESKVQAAEARVDQVRQSRSGAFHAWLAKSGLSADVPGLVGHYPLNKGAKANVLANLAAADKPGRTSPSNTIVPGRSGEALQFTGDDPADFPGVLGSLDREQPFTAAFWLRTPEPLSRAIIFQRQRGSDTGFQGLECSFDKGRIFFGLIRFWPGNAAAVRTHEKVPCSQWMHIAVSYDGSGTARGLRIDVNGQPAEIEIVRDSLNKNLEAGGSGLTFGARFRSIGLKGALLDELRLYDRCLSPIEVGQLYDGRRLTEALEKRDASLLANYYFAVVDPEMKTAQAELREARRKYFAAQTEVFEIMTMKELPRPRQAYILKRGQYDAPKNQPVTRDTPSALPPFGTKRPHNRLGLAEWLTDPRHPLTARVAVNRYWQMFFGHGLVRTPENFGVQGALPTHPQLLDWLARDFVNNGWNVKRLAKEIVLSATYRQQSAANAALRERDPENLLLARGPSRRLSAEMLRDAALFDGGLLIERIGGPPTRPYQPPGLWKGQNSFLPRYVADKGEGLYRRSLYTFWRRTSPPPNMLAFDAPSREVCTVRRTSTNTALQPLVLLNDPQFVEASRGLGERMLREPGSSIGERLAFAFQVATSRPPTSVESRALGTLFTAEQQRFKGHPDAARQYLKVGDRAFCAAFDPTELAAAAETADAILNLDAAVMTR